MNSIFSRRNLLQGVGTAFMASTLLKCSIHTRADVFQMPAEGTGTPKICLGVWPNIDEAEMLQLKQIGVDYVLTAGPPIPWQESVIRQQVQRFKAGGLTLYTLILSGFDDVIQGKPGADAQIDDVIKSIRAAGKAGVRVLEYNLYANRLMEGYKEVSGRAGASYTSFQYDRSKHLMPVQGVGIHTRQNQLKRIEHFLRAVVPEAERANVLLALHPNDPPVLISRGSEQIAATFEHWKDYLNLVNSPYNGITFDCGVAREMGEDPVKVCRYLAERDRINHVHFRNVVVRKPYVDYTEVFVDNGEVDMFAVMRELVRQNYSRAIYPEHPRAIDFDCERGQTRTYYPGGGGRAGDIYNVGYTRAMLQAALLL